MSMSMDYILVSANGQDPVELECEDDGSYLLSSLTALVGGESAGLMYDNPDTGRPRGVKVRDGELLTPRGGWGDENRVYRVVFKARDGSSSAPIDVDGLSCPSPLPRCAPTQVRVKMEYGVDDSTVRTPPGSDTKPTSVPDLSKMHLRQVAGTSLVARRALSQWNKMNTTIRGIVAATEFEGTGGLSRCEGTSVQQANANQAIRQQITERPEVKAFYETLVLENGSGKITLDHTKAAEHIRTVLNNRKRPPVGPKTTAVISKEATPDQCPPAVPPSTKQTSDSTVPSATPRKGGRQKRARNVLKEMQPDGADANMDSSKKKKLDDLDIDNETPRSEYELQRAKKMQENLEFLEQIGLSKKILEKGDAILVSRAWFRGTLGAKVKVSDILQESDEYGLSPPKKTASLREALEHFGNELAKNNLVELAKKGGLKMADIVVLK